MTTTEDVVARARAVIARLREVEDGWAAARDAYMTTPESERLAAIERIDFLSDERATARSIAAPALLALAEAAAELGDGNSNGLAWYRYYDNDADVARCVLCDALLDVGESHGVGCPAPKIDAALAELAELAGDEGAANDDV